jgi:hypothetical protein
MMQNVKKQNVYKIKLDLKNLLNLTVPHHERQRRKPPSVLHAICTKYCKDLKKDIPMNITDHKCNKQITNCILLLWV